MRLMPGSPRPVLPAILALTLTAFLPQLSSGATPFPQDLEPISTVGRECEFKISCVAMVILVAGVEIKVKQGLLRYYWGTWRGGVDVFKSMFAASQFVKGLFLIKNKYLFL